MNLEALQEQWKSDSVIDPEKYGEESTRIPQLHLRYMETVSYTHLTLPTILRV